MYKAGEVVKTRYNMNFMITAQMRNASGILLDRYYGIYDDGSAGDIDGDRITGTTGNIVDINSILEEIK